jgi:hypothetical protein
MYIKTNPNCCDRDDKLSNLIPISIFIGLVCITYLKLLFIETKIILKNVM